MGVLSGCLKGEGVVFFGIRFSVYSVVGCYVVGMGCA